MKELSDLVQALNETYRHIEAMYQYQKCDSSEIQRASKLAETLTEGITRRANVPSEGSMRIDIYQQDWIPGFAAFLDDGSVQVGATAKVGLNVGALMAAVETKDLQSCDVPYVVAETIMHEVMHALEAWAGVEFSEDRIEALIAKYRGGVAQWTERGVSNADDAGSSPAAPASTSNGNTVPVCLPVVVQWDWRKHCEFIEPVALLNRALAPWGVRLVFLATVVRDDEYRVRVEANAQHHAEAGRPIA